MPTATLADFYAFQGKQVPLPLPNDIVVSVNALLDDAAEELQGVLRFARYRVDTTGEPTETYVTTAIVRAICAQAVYFENNPESRTEAIRQFDSISAGSMTLSTNRGSNTGTGKGDLLIPTASVRALRILKNAGILPTTVRGLR